MIEIKYKLVTSVIIVCILSSGCLGFVSDADEKKSNEYNRESILSQVQILNGGNETRHLQVKIYRGGTLLKSSEFSLREMYGKRIERNWELEPGSYRIVFEDLETGDVVEEAVPTEHSEYHGQLGVTESGDLNIGFRPVA